MPSKEELQYRAKQLQELFNENIHWYEKLTDEEKEYENNINIESAIMEENEIEQIDKYIKEENESWEKQEIENNYKEELNKDTLDTSKNITIENFEDDEDENYYNFCDEAEKQDGCRYNEILSVLEYGRTKEGKVYAQYYNKEKDKIITHYVKCPDCGYEYFVYNGHTKDGQRIIQCKNKECPKRKNSEKRGRQFTLNEYFKIAYKDDYFFEQLDKNNTAKEIRNNLEIEEIENSIMLSRLANDQQQNAILKIIRMGVAYNALGFMEIYSDDEIDEFVKLLDDEKYNKKIVTLINKGIEPKQIKYLKEQGKSLDDIFVVNKNTPLKYKKERHIMKGLTTIYKNKKSEQYKNYQIEKMQ